MLTLATILDNPGEPPAETRYRDPGELRRLGYDGLVIYATTGLSGLLGHDTIANSDIRRWVGEQFESTEQTIQRARAADLKVWLFYDAPSLARELVGSAMTCTRNDQVLCPASDELLDMSGQCVDALIARFPDIEGIVLRLGDTDAHRLPYLMGNDIYSPHCARCNTLGRADRLVRFIRFYHNLVVNKLGRKLLVRAWNVRPGGLHDSAELANRVVDQLPDDRENLLLSFKFTQTDFWRYQQWNPSSLVCGDRPIIYELECQREFEGKGAMPNYQPPLWRDGMTELDGAIGLAEVSRRTNLAGLWAWVRGGGYGGPYLSPEAETWIDANVTAVPQLAANPNANLDDLARQWIADRLDCRDAAAASALHTALTHSTQTALESFYIGPYAKLRDEPWYPSGNFIQDDVIDAEVGFSLIQRLPDSALDEVVAEKQRAVERIAQDRRAIQQVAGNLGARSGEAMVHQMEYTESLIETLRFLLGAMVNYRRLRKRRDDSIRRATTEAVNLCQSYWNHHQRYANFRGTATAFRSDNLWDFTQQMIDRATR